MRRILLLLVLGLVCGTGWLAVDRTAEQAQADVAGVTGPSLQQQIRYIGRDGRTGIAARVDDRYIAEVDESYENYGKVESVAVPPPPAGEVDLARLIIPDIGVDSRLQRYGLDKFGRLDVPADATTVGWHPAYSTMPGEGGSSFFAAHYSWAGGPGVFSKLSTLKSGAVVEVRESTGQVARYRVTSVVDYPLATIDMGALLDGRPGLETIVLMTCSGPPNEGEYPLRTVVLAVREA